MTKNDDSPSNLRSNSNNNHYNLKHIFKSCFIANSSEEKLIDWLVEKICDINDYMKSIFCIGIAIEILKPDGLKIEMKNKSNDVFSCFIKSQNKIVLNIDADKDIVYISLLGLFLYKWLDIIEISYHEKNDLKDVLDQVFDNSSLFYEELTQKEIKMLEWLDRTLVDLVQSMNENCDVYKIDTDSIDKNLVDLVSVYFMWGRNLERLEIVSQILNPLLDYINDTILTKLEKFVSKNYVDIDGLPDYLKIKLTTIKMVNKENIPAKKIFKILKEVRTLEVPYQTSKTFKKFKYSLDSITKQYNALDVYNKFKDEKKLYKYSILQRHDELNCIKEKKNRLLNDKKNNSEIIEQLTNLEDLINDEVKDLENSLDVIDKKINLLKKAGV